MKSLFWSVLESFFLSFLGAFNSIVAQHQSHQQAIQPCCNITILILQTCNRQPQLLNPHKLAHTTQHKDYAPMKHMLPYLSLMTHHLRSRRTKPCLGISESLVEMITNTPPQGVTADQHCSLMACQVPASRKPSPPAYVA